MLVVVGGHSRNIGKTSVVAGLIRKLRDRKWTALKITQYGNGVCANHTVAAGCGCEPSGGEEFALTEEYSPAHTAFSPIPPTNAPFDGILFLSIV